MGGVDTLRVDGRLDANGISFLRFTSSCSSFLYFFCLLFGRLLGPFLFLDNGDGWMDGMGGRGG